MIVIGKKRWMAKSGRRKGPMCDGPQGLLQRLLGFFARARVAVEALDGARPLEAEVSAREERHWL